MAVMTIPQKPEDNERLSTYVVDHRDLTELDRLRVQDRLLTASMGGVLPEQSDPSAFRRVLDIGCGSGSWVVEAAQTYPEMSLVGIDISKRMVDSAPALAEQEGVAARTRFQVMDALQLLDFEHRPFDLTNLRLGVSFMRTWDWPKMLGEMLRVTRRKGIIRLTDSQIVHTSTSKKLTELQERMVLPLYRSGHLFEEDSDGIIKHLVPLLKQHIGEQVEEKVYEFVYEAGTPEGELFYQDVVYSLQTLRPFFKKWGANLEGYDKLSAEAMEEMQQPGFVVRWKMVTAWAIVPYKR